ncbi:hypothetical protein PMI33_05036 [Pseudomonas sp. GM67]|nr:hypothetical protein PMI33_05036 [Pseudomonas sp. GM67]
MFGNSIVPDYHEWIAQNLSHENLTIEVLRLEAARRLLEESECNIEQIAQGGGLGMRSGCGLRFSAIWGFAEGVSEAVFAVMREVWSKLPSFGYG